MFGYYVSRSLMVAAILISFGTMTLYGQSRVTYVTGAVDIERDGGTIAAEIGMPVQQSDVVRTGADAFAIVELADGAEIKLRASTRVELSSLGEETSVRLERGGIFSRVAEDQFSGTYSVRTSTVTAGVRGTEFFVAFGRTIEERPDVWLCVNTGVVDVAVADTGQTTAVEEGEGINILSGTELTNPRFYDWTTELNWNMDPSQGPIEDTTDLDQAYSDLLDQDYD